jgi:CRISPR-associated protein Cmr2
VLALLPLDSAIACAKDIQRAYQAAMQANGLSGTISAAIVFAHYHLPLSFVMAESDHLLKDVAKKHNGRNSLAVAVHKPGGLHLEWTSRWDAAATDPDHPVNHQAVQTLLDLVAQFNPGRGGNAQNLPLSSGFLYRIRERWGDLCTRNAQDQPELQFSPTHVQQLWAADLLANRDLGKVSEETRKQAKELAARLFAISRDNRNTILPTHPSPNPDVVNPNVLFSESGALLVRFLATKGVQR